MSKEADKYSLNLSGMAKQFGSVVLMDFNMRLGFNMHLNACKTPLTTLSSWNSDNIDE